MADVAHQKPTHADVSNALRSALKKLRARYDEALPDSCTDLWDDSLELIEQLMAIEEELDAEIRCNAEFDWRGAPQRIATTTEFICWIVREINHG